MTRHWNPIQTISMRNYQNYEKNVGNPLVGFKSYHIHGPVTKKVIKMHKATEIVALIYINTKQTKTRVL